PGKSVCQICLECDCRTTDVGDRGELARGTLDQYHHIASAEIGSIGRRGYGRLIRIGTLQCCCRTYYDELRSEDATTHVYQCLALRTLTWFNCGEVSCYQWTLLQDCQFERHRDCQIEGRSRRDAQGTPELTGILVGIYLRHHGLQRKRL